MSCSIVPFQLLQLLVQFIQHEQQELLRVLQCIQSNVVGFHNMHSSSQIALFSGKAEGRIKNLRQIAIICKVLKLPDNFKNLTNSFCATANWALEFVAVWQLLGTIQD